MFKARGVFSSHLHDLVESLRQIRNPDIPCHALHDANRNSPGSVAVTVQAYLIRNVEVDRDDFVGVFSHFAKKGPASRHSQIGRVEVDVSTGFQDICRPLVCDSKHLRGIALDFFRAVQLLADGIRRNDMRIQGFPVRAFPTSGNPDRYIQNTHIGFGSATYRVDLRDIAFCFIELAC